MKPILVTGAAGAIGEPLCAELAHRGMPVRRFDLVPTADGGGALDILRPALLASAVRDCRGVIHLAAVSRVGHGEADPERCWITNVDGTRRVIQSALDSAARPWLLFASSREVYGQAGRLPVTGGEPLLPINRYGHSKLAGERAIAEAGAAGLRAAVLRLPNVYGSPTDHPDRVIPALIGGALRGEPLTVAGPQRRFDFLHIDDAVFGLLALVEQLEAGVSNLPPVTLGTGRPITLGDLAAQIRALTGYAGAVRTIEAPAHEVSAFWADPAPAAQLLGWRPQIRLPDGLQALVAAMRLKSTIRPQKLEEGVRP